jgi:hypothetical protein
MSKRRYERHQCHDPSFCELTAVPETEKDDNKLVPVETYVGQFCRLPSRKDAPSNAQMNIGVLFEMVTTMSILSNYYLLFWGRKSSNAVGRNLFLRRGHYRPN